MSNLQRYDNNGIELIINTETGESFASKRGYARIASIDESTVRKRIKRAGESFAIKSVQIPTPGGL